MLGRRPLGSRPLASWQQRSRPRALAGTVTSVHALALDPNVPPVLFRSLVRGNRIRVATDTIGTGPLTLGEPLPGRQSFERAGVRHNDHVWYTILDGEAWEIGVATYRHCVGEGPSLTRITSESSNPDHAPLDLSGRAVVFASLTKEHFPMAPQSPPPKVTLIKTHYCTEPGEAQWIKPEGLVEVRVVLVGGGGAGGPALITETGQISVGRSGGGGGYLEAVIPADRLKAIETVTIGHGGIAGSAINGEPSCFAAFKACGGEGGVSVEPFDQGVVTGACGGEAIGGDLIVPGGAGSVGLVLGSEGASGAGGMSGNGLGMGGPPAVTGLTAPGEDGKPGSGHGGGGSGAANGANSAATRPGGNGAPGLVIIEAVAIQRQPQLECTPAEPEYA